MTGSNCFNVFDLADYFEMNALIVSIFVIYCWHNNDYTDTVLFAKLYHNTRYDKNQMTIKTIT